MTKKSAIKIDITLILIFLALLMVRIGGFELPWELITLPIWGSFLVNFFACIVNKFTR